MFWIKKRYTLSILFSAEDSEILVDDAETGEWAFYENGKLVEEKQNEKN